MENCIVELNHIQKSFPGVKALDDVSFRLNAGEVLALLGENGAGKSTLMKVLSGVYTKDSGDITIFGKSYEHITPKLAQELGIVIIHQELQMCSHLTVAENIFLGREKTKNGILSNREMNEKAKEILEWLKIDLNPKTVVSNLPVSKQQMVEIAKALSMNAKILIMDEPTSALTSKEIDELFLIIKQLKKQGCGIVYISHRLEELEHIVDRVTIMRDGKYITSMNFHETTMEEMIAHMVGREIKEKFPKVKTERGNKILEVKNVSAGSLVKDISFDVYEGETLGIAGLMGAGRTELTRVIFGIDPMDSGTLILDGKELSIRCPMDAISAGIVLAPEDRKKDGLCVGLSIKDNVALPNMDMLCNSLGVVNKKKEREMTKQAIQNLKIKTASDEVNAGTLSGGNQQKVVIGKWLARQSRIVIFDEPTRGIDVAAKVEIYHLINELKKSGIGVIVISSEMPEILGVSDRILVMCDGRLTGEMQAEEATQDKILTYATRFESKIEKKQEV